MPHKKHSQGFTLVEIIIVITLLAFLALIIILITHNNINKANDAKRKADIAAIGNALEEYYSDNDCYPDAPILSVCGSDALKPYLNEIPCDPVYKDPYCYFVTDPSPSAACYQKYHLLSTLKYLSDSEIKSLGCDGSDYCGWESACGTNSQRYGFNYGVASRNIPVANPNFVAAPIITTPPPGLPNPESGEFACAPPGQGQTVGFCNHYGPYAIVNCKYTFADEVICDQYCKKSSIYWCKQ